MEVSQFLGNIISRSESILAKHGVPVDVWRKVDLDATMTSALFEERRLNEDILKTLGVDPEIYKSLMIHLSLEAGHLPGFEQEHNEITEQIGPPMPLEGETDADWEKRSEIWRAIQAARLADYGLTEAIDSRSFLLGLAIGDRTLRKELRSIEKRRLAKVGAKKRGRLNSTTSFIHWLVSKTEGTDLNKILKAVEDPANLEAFARDHANNDIKEVHWRIKKEAVEWHFFNGQKKTIEYGAIRRAIKTAPSP